MSRAATYGMHMQYLTHPFQEEKEVQKPVTKNFCRQDVLLHEALAEMLQIQEDRKTIKLLQNTSLLDKV